jgi:hypothetical protein
MLRSDTTGPVVAVDAIDRSLWCRLICLLLLLSIDLSPAVAAVAAVDDTIDLSVVDQLVRCCDRSVVAIDGSDPLLSIDHLLSTTNKSTLRISAVNRSLYCGQQQKYSPDLCCLLQ